MLKFQIQTLKTRINKEKEVKMFSILMTKTKMLWIKIWKNKQRATLILGCFSE